jgi:hypothetical protein
VSGQIVLSNDQEGYFAKMSPDGNVIWENVFSGAANSSDVIYKVIAEGDECYWAGQTMGITSKSDILLFKTNPSGTIGWEVKYDGAIHGNDRYEYFQNDRDNNFIISAMTEELYQTTYGTILKFSNPMGIEDDLIALNNMSIYPNPVSDIIYFDDHLKGDYSICDMKGSELLSGELDGSQINVGKLSTGLYLLHFTDGNISYYAKFVKQ